MYLLNARKGKKRQENSRKSKRLQENQRKYKKNVMKKQVQNTDMEDRIAIPSEIGLRNPGQATTPWARICSGPVHCAMAKYLHGELTLHFLWEQAKGNDDFLWEQGNSRRVNGCGREIDRKWEE